MKKSYQKKAKVAICGFFVATLTILSFPKISFAQQDVPKNTGSGVVFANVNMRDAKIEKQEKNVLTISFNISNDFEKVQPGILLRASLQKKENDLLTVVDEKIIGSVFTLAANEKIHREITYTVPDFLQGQYEIWLHAQTIGSFPLSTARVGETTFSGTNDHIEIINSSCFLKVKGESDDKKYTLFQGVDIEKNENLQAICDLMNHSDQQRKFSAQFETFQHNTFGPLLETSQQSDASFTLQPKEKKQFAFNLPGAQDPQVYDVKITLRENKKTISNSAVFHYVLRGASASIQSLQMDKQSYQKGESAKASLIITGPADNFPDNRHGKGTDLKGTSLSVKIQSGKTLCGETQKNHRLGDLVDSVEIAIAENCPEPMASAILKDSAGNILSQKDFFIGKNSQAEMEKAVRLEADKKSGKSSITFLIIFIGLAILAAIIFIAWKLKKKSSIIFPILFFGLGLAISFHMARPAKALTLGYTDPMNVTPYAEGNIDKSTYYPGEAITVSGGSVSFYACGNGGGPFIFPFYAAINGGTYNLSGNFTSQTAYAESVPGNYYANFTLTGWENSSYSGSIPYTVINPAVSGSCGWANGTSSCAAPSGGLCSSGSPSGVSDVGYWSWSCAGYYGGSTASCSATKSVINASCGWALGDTTNPFQPTDGFCGPGYLAGGVIDNGTSWSWTCASDCNGTSASCNKPKPIINGECRNGQTFCKNQSLSDADLCLKGTASIHVAPNTFDTNFSWLCQGYNGGVSVSCSASTYSDVKTKTISNVCQGSSITTDAASLCYSGKSPYTASVLQDYYNYQWTCRDSCLNLTTSLSYPKEALTNGKCGTADGKTICDNSRPTLCEDPETASIDYPDWGSIYDISWTCGGSCGGSTASCSAKGTKSCGWIETNP